MSELEGTGSYNIISELEGIRACKYSVKKNVIISIIISTKITQIISLQIYYQPIPLHYWATIITELKTIIMIWSHYIIAVLKQPIVS